MEEEGRACLRFNKDMLPYLTELSAQFTKYRLKAVAKMDSAHAIRLYELLAQWRGVGKREMAVDRLRETFHLGDRYPSIKDFKKCVIDVAVSQINEHSDLTASTPNARPAATSATSFSPLPPRSRPSRNRRGKPPRRPNRPAPIPNFCTGFRVFAKQAWARANGGGISGQ